MYIFKMYSWKIVINEKNVLYKFIRGGNELFWEYKYFVQTCKNKKNTWTFISSNPLPFYAKLYDSFL